MFRYRDLQLLNSVYVHSGTEMVIFVGFKNPSCQLCWKVQVHIVKLTQNLMCVMSVIWVSKEWVRKGMSLPDSFMDIVL